MIAVIVAVTGTGTGCCFQPTLVALQAHCTKSQRAVIISDRNYFRCLGGACGLAVSAALLQATLRSNLPPGYEYLSNSTYSLPAKSSVSDAAWEHILEAYAKASHSVFILQVPLVAVCLIACLFVRDRGLERPNEPGDDVEKRGAEQSEAGALAMKDPPDNDPNAEERSGPRELASEDPGTSTPNHLPREIT